MTPPTTTTPKKTAKLFKRNSTNFILRLIVLETEPDIIPNNFATLDGIEGFFYIFTEYSEISTSNKMSGGTDGNPKIMTFDFSSYTDVSQFNNVGFAVRGLSINDAAYASSYVLTDDTSKNYLGITRKVLWAATLTAR